MIVRFGTADKVGVTALDGSELKQKSVTRRSRATPRFLVESKWLKMAQTLYITVKCGQTAVMTLLIV